MIHTVKGFGIVNKAEINVSLGLSCFFNDPADVGNLISGSSAFSKTSLNIWKFMVHVLLKPGLENFEHYITSVWDECNCAIVWAFFGIAFLWDCNENWPFPVLWLSLQNDLFLCPRNCILQKRRGSHGLMSMELIDFTVCAITFKEAETPIVLQLQWLLVNSCLLLYSKAVCGSFLSALQIAGFLLVFENYSLLCCRFLVRLDLKWYSVPVKWKWMAVK